MTLADAEYAAVSDAVRRQNRPLAIDLALRALEGGHRHPLILVLAAEAMEERGRATKAIELLTDATRAAPKHKVAWMRLAALLARRRHFGEAAAAFEAVLAIDEASFPANMGAGEMRLLLRDLPAAERYYRRAAELEPRAAEPVAVLALMAAQGRDTTTARNLAAKAVALQPGILGAEMALARSDVLEGFPARAQQRLTRLLDRPGLDAEHRAGALDVRADALDRLDRPAEAFADYDERNAILFRQNAGTFAADAPDRPLTIARGLAAFLSESSPDAWRASAGRDRSGEGAVRKHVFLVGFPRSGTTLLEKALAGHPAVATLEEVNHLASAGRGLRDTPEGWRRLIDIDEAEADRRRRIYWDGVKGSLGPDLDGKILVDKLPLHTVALPVIAKLFPDARILFALRDPRDVVLSCFRRRFTVNAAMFEFLTLPGAADYYDAVMSLGEIARSRLALAVREVRHESVVADFDREMGEILEFIGAGWHAEVRNFAGRVGGQMRTPSYGQLVRGLNAEGIGQWRRYRDQMSPILGVLAPWADRFGYDAAPNSELHNSTAK